MKVVAGISPIVFHATSLENGLGVLKTNRFELQPLQNRSEQKLFPHHNIYYLSTSRTRVNWFLQMEKPDSVVVFELDGRKLASVAKGTQIKFFSVTTPDEKDRLLNEGMNEQEDRIYSKRPDITNARRYIKTTHIVFNEKFASHYLNFIAVLNDRKMYWLMYSNLNNFMQRKAVKNPDDFVRKQMQQLPTSERLSIDIDLDTSEADFLLAVLNYVTKLKSHNTVYQVEKRLNDLAKKHEVTFHFKTDAFDSFMRGKVSNSLFEFSDHDRKSLTKLINKMNSLKIRQFQGIPKFVQNRLNSVLFGDSI